MRRITLTMVLVTAAWSLVAQEDGRHVFDLYGGVMYRGTGSQTLKITVEGAGLVVSGRASGVTPGGGGGYVIEARENLEFNGYKTLIIKVSGISDADNFDTSKLLKLELNKRARQTSTTAMRNRNDPDYINARNEEAEFDLSALRNIRSVNLVFFNCEMKNVRIEMFYQK